jgi:hypothetical protein
MSAYWISPKGVIYEVDSHIRSILENPGLFGLTMEAITAVYEHYHERLNQERNACEEIMVGLMDRGWIRVRHIRQLSLVTVQLSDRHYTGGSHAKPVTKWAEEILKKQALPESSPVNVLNLRGEYVMPSGFPLYEIASGALYGRRNPSRSRRVTRRNRKK